MDRIDLEGRVALSERRRVNAFSSIEEELEILQDQIKALVSLQKIANLEVPAGRMDANLEHAAPGKCQSSLYVIGLFGTGRRYINRLIIAEHGRRGQVFPGYDLSACRSNTSDLQRPCHHQTRSFFPSVPAGGDEPYPGSSRIGICGFDLRLSSSPRFVADQLDLVADLHSRKQNDRTGVSQVFKNPDDLCDYLDQNFFEFEAFAEGDPDYYAAVPGPRFLSFQEFVEETCLLRQSATLALRLEDFMIDPLREFSRLAQVMSVDLDLSELRLACPRTRLYGHLMVRDKVPRFRSFIDRLNAETRARIEKIGYQI